MENGLVFFRFEKMCLNEWIAIGKKGWPKANSFSSKLKRINIKLVGNYKTRWQQIVYTFSNRWRCEKIEKVLLHTDR